MAERFQPLDPSALTPEQKRVFEAIGASPRGTVPWIFHLYLASPDLASRVQELGAFCRYRTGLPAHLSELAILIVARHWGADYEWSIHRVEAQKAGVPERVIAAIEAGKEPGFDNDDAALIYDFATEFFRHNDVGNELFERALARFGRQTLVELAGILGYYSMLAIAIRLFRLPPEK
jgi:4-carboxymuconolactone decarboxylase